MRIRALLLASTATVTAALAFGATGASAATLFTSTAHTARVAVGAVASASASTPIILTSSTSAINSCSGSTLNLQVTQNTDAGGVAATVTGGAFSGCSPFSPGLTFTPPWRLTVTGNGTVVGANTQWNASFDNVRFDLNGGLYTGNLTTGVVAFQPTAGTSPLCIRFSDAGTLSGPLTGNGRIDGNFCFEGAAAGWSLTN